MRKEKENCTHNRHIAPVRGCTIASSKCIGVVRDLHHVAGGSGRLDAESSGRGTGTAGKASMGSSVLAVIARIA